ncbi:MAG: hypothetical protein ABI771_06530 [Betaproteobacteria bacterium]
MPIDPSKKVPADAEDNSTEHEWAEYNLPVGFLRRAALEDEDKFAFVGFGVDPDAGSPENS